MKKRDDLRLESSEKQLAYAVAQREYESSLRRNYPYGSKAILAGRWFREASGDGTVEDVQVEVVGFVLLTPAGEAVVVSIPDESPLSKGYLCYADSPGTYGFVEGRKRRLVGVTPFDLTPLR